MNNYGSTNKRELFRLVVRLSLPSMWAQVSSVVMQYIDAAMLGHLNADAAAAAGVVASVTWLFGGLCAALTTGFTVQAAQASGGGEQACARGIMRHGLWVAFSVGMRFAQTTVVGMIAPLGNVAMAAHSLAITAESFCYMPAYGIGLAQVAITGREIGAGDKKRAKEMGWAGIGFAAMVTIALSVVLFLFALQLMRMLTPDPELILLGTKILRIEAFAELMYSTQLVCAGILQGRGDTLVSSTLMLGSLWLVRVPLSMLLIPPLGLAGAWLAMSIELNVRGILFLLRFQFSKR